MPDWLNICKQERLDVDVTLHGEPYTNSKLQPKFNIAARLRNVYNNDNIPPQPVTMSSVFLTSKYVVVTFDMQSCLSKRSSVVTINYVQLQSYFAACEDETPAIRNHDRVLQRLCEHLDHALLYG